MAQTNRKEIEAHPQAIACMAGENDL